MNNWIGIGNLVKEVDLKYLPSGKAVTKFTIAINSGFGDKQKVDYINIVCFDKLAEICANYLDKGKKCAIQGRISTSSYETKNGEKRNTTEIVAERVEFLSTEKKENKKDTVNDFLNNFPDDDNDIFQPVDDSDLIPF